MIYGRQLSWGSSIQIEPLVGLNYAYLKQNIVSSYNATYIIANRFGVSAVVGGSLLAGSVSSNTNFNSYGGGNKVLTPTQLANQSQNMVVPEVDAKLEASYTMPFNAKGSSINFALGYLFAAYFNAINQVVPASLVPGAFNGGTIAIETASQVQSNINLNGPYASFTLTF